MDLQPLAENPDERRRFLRVAGDGLMARLGGRLISVADISLGGMRVAPAPHVRKGELAQMQLIPLEGEKMCLDRAVDAWGLVLAADENGVRLAFEGLRLSQARLIMTHVRRQRCEHWIRLN